VLPVVHLIVNEARPISKEQEGHIKDSSDNNCPFNRGLGGVGTVLGLLDGDSSDAGAGHSQQF